MLNSPLMTVMIDAARKASRSLKRDFGEVEALLVSLKGPGDFVSAADRKAESVIHEALAKARPGFGFKMEESGSIEGSDTTHRWHIDPLDGTANFLHGIPQCAISIALEREGVIMAGLVYDFLKDEMFLAERGKGAFLNNRRLRVSARRSAPEALIGTGVPHIGKSGHASYLDELRRVMARFQNVRRLGSAALDICYVAAGRLDAFWEHDLNSWDVAAGLCILREAGGFASDLRGEELSLDGPISIVCGNEAIHPQLLKALAGS